MPLTNKVSSSSSSSSATYSHGKMYLMEMLNRASEVQNLPSIASDRYALADEISSAGLRPIAPTVLPALWWN